MLLVSSDIPKKKHLHFDKILAGESKDDFCQLESFPSNILISLVQLVDYNVIEFSDRDSLANHIRHSQEWQDINIIYIFNCLNWSIQLES